MCILDSSQVIIQSRGKKDNQQLLMKSYLPPPPPPQQRAGGFDGVRSGAGEKVELVNVDFDVVSFWIRFKALSGFKVTFPVAFIL